MVLLSPQWLKGGQAYERGGSTRLPELRQRIFWSIKILSGVHV
jgi:hypothetical protein